MLELCRTAGPTAVGVLRDTAVRSPLPAIGGACDPHSRGIRSRVAVLEQQRSEKEPGVAARGGDGRIMRTATIAAGGMKEGLPAQAPEQPYCSGCSVLICFKPVTRESKKRGFQHLA